MVYDGRREKKTSTEHGVVRIGSVHSLGDRYPGRRIDRHGRDTVSADLHDIHGRTVVPIHTEVRQHREYEDARECNDPGRGDAEMPVLRKTVLSRHRHIGTPDVFVVRQLHEVSMNMVSIKPFKLFQQY